MRNLFKLVVGLICYLSLVIYFNIGVSAEVPLIPGTEIRDNIETNPTFDNYIGSLKNGNTVIADGNYTGTRVSGSGTIIYSLYDEYSVEKVVVYCDWLTNTMGTFQKI